jgi:hypothetical protein
MGFMADDRGNESSRERGAADSMALSQTYLEWEKQTERRGREISLEEERRATILN